MLVFGLDGKQYKINLAQKLGKTRGKVSSYHEQARQLLKELYPFDPILEELNLPGCPTQLYLDFFIPARKLAIEVHGEQHYSYSEFFHSTPEGFKKSNIRDKSKQRWCDENNIYLVVLPYGESIDEWRTRIINR